MLWISQVCMGVWVCQSVGVATPLCPSPFMLPLSADGKKLASVGLDDNHLIVVWDWRRGEQLATTRGHKDKIFVVRWSTSSSDHLITVGVKHIKFWTQAGMSMREGLVGGGGRRGRWEGVQGGVGGRVRWEGLVGG